MHEAVTGTNITIPNKPCTKITLHDTTEVAVKTEVCNGSMLDDWQNYADRLLFMALSCHWQGNDTAANQYFAVAKDTWDGVGINDTATKQARLYTTYKLALLLYTSRILGERLPFEFDLVSRMWALQRATDGGIVTHYYANGTRQGEANTETTALVVIAVFTFRSAAPLLAFYYPWYGTPEVSDCWRHWNDTTHDPDMVVGGRRQIAARHYPLLDVYDSNNETLIREHMRMAKRANIDGFVVSWWGIGSFEDAALQHLSNVAEQDDFSFTIYYENTSSVNDTVADMVYILETYAGSTSWYRIDTRPVIYVYARAIEQLTPTVYWKIDGDPAVWSLSEDVRQPPRSGLFVIHPYEDGVGYLESPPLPLSLNETYCLQLAVSDVRNDCSPDSDVGFRIRIRNGTEGWNTVDDLVVHFDDGWRELSYDLSSYAGQTVTVRVESYAGGVVEWCSEWAAIDYLYVTDSKGNILNNGPYFDNEWQTVVDRLHTRGYDPLFIMDFGDYMHKLRDFADHFLNFTDGLHTYAPINLPWSEVLAVYDEAATAAHERDKIFSATVMPGYDDTEIRSPGTIVDRQNGTYYTSFWHTAAAAFPDSYVITSFNEWHEGSEIEPSLEYGQSYIDMTIPESPSQPTFLAILVIVVTLTAITTRKIIRR
jgi:hypothetical protein